MWLLDQLFRPRVIAPPELLPEVRDLRKQLDVTQQLLKEFDARLRVIATMPAYNKREGTPHDRSIYPPGS
jgi:hypothetical protein